MAPALSIGSETTVAEIVALARQKMETARAKPGDIATVGEFIGQFYRTVAPGDIVGKPLESLYGAARSSWSQVQQRRVPGKLAIRAFNPTSDEHGWTCEHTVIEIVNDDMPFLVDSVTAALAGLDLEVHVIIHPVISVERDAKGDLVRLLPAAADAHATESVMHVEVTRQTDADKLAQIVAELTTVLEDVRSAVTDWPEMRARLDEALASDIPEEECNECRAFLEWLRDSHFTFLGSRVYHSVEGGAGPALRVDADSGLGVLRDPERRVFDELQANAAGQVEVRIFNQDGPPLIVAKSIRRSTVHRPVAMDAIVVKRRDDAGKVVGIWLFLGLFTAEVYTNSPVNVPMLGGKIARVIAAAGYRRNSHDGKKLLSILENLPRDELFQSSETHLGEVAVRILQLQERRRVALFLRADDFHRFMSCLVYVPRDRFDTPLRLKVQDILAKAFSGEILSYYTQIGDSPLARLQVLVRTDPGRMPAFDHAEIEARIANVARAWEDNLRDALYRGLGEEKGAGLHRRYARAFPVNYTEHFDADTAVFDISRVEDILKSGELGLNLYRPLEAQPGEIRLKVFHAGAAVPLSDILPMLEGMGLRVMEELPYALKLADGAERNVWIHDFGMRAAHGGEVDIQAVRQPFQDALKRVWTGEIESDGFNRLVIGAGLTAREVIVLRAYAKYLRQVGFAFSQTYIAGALLDHADVTRMLVDLFHARNDPAQAAVGVEAAAVLEAKILQALDAVESADADRILRRYLNLVRATLRTNYYQTEADGSHRPTLAFKLSSRDLEDLPKPRPWVETFVYSPRLEAVHLRGGKVARGGIRWSDRPEDFRTEILGLIKAQMVKNAVIVPVGAKGGFIVKRPPTGGGREAFLAEGIACYKLFMRALLGLADNLVGGAVVPPKDTVRHDGNDPYLVVAADKGTATFSDIANAESQAAGFWLDDAFASGGSQGYDHKVMGITARGAWESVKRHFRELGRDIQTRPFTAVGVGDMAGDVFGNGMLMSRQTHLVGAFNHMHIFLDPNPADPEASFVERQRLFDTPRSTWADYDAKLISQGGGVFSRQAKSFKVSPEVKARFGLATDVVTPTEMIRAILGAEVDLLFFGGIGTYLRASDETDAEVGDRANDAVRLSAKMVRAKVVGEGANLGVTQRARIEFSQLGGRINTDAIDNSAGVDCSDHEVNIKILLNEIVARGDMTVKQRNTLLATMTDDVAQLVLRDNYLQTQALSMMEAHGADRLDEQARLIRHLERIGRLDRGIEFLPSEEELAERIAKRGVLTRPEAAVVMPYCKLWLFDELIDSDLPDEAQLDPELIGYFPEALRTGFAAAIHAHRLRREIVATVIGNAMINRIGGTFLTEMIEETGRTPSDITRAFIVARTAFSLEALWAAIEALDNQVPAQIQLGMLMAINRAVQAIVSWILRHTPAPVDIPGLSNRLKAGVEAILPSRMGLDPQGNDLGRTWLASGAPDDLVRRILALGAMVSVPDVVTLGETRKVAIPMAGIAYDRVGERFGFGWLRAQAAHLVPRTHWQKLAIGALMEDFAEQQRDVAQGVLALIGEGGTPDAVEPALAQWIAANAYAVDQADRLLGEYQDAAQPPDLAMLTVAARQYRTMARS